MHACVCTCVSMFKQMHLNPVHHYLHLYHHFKHARLRLTERLIFTRHFFKDERKVTHVRTFALRREDALSSHLAVLLNGSA